MGDGDRFSVTTSGFDDLARFATSTQSDIERSAQRALNKAADRAKANANRMMREQIHLPATYLNDRLSVSKRASAEDLEAIVRGTDSPVSLARFSQGTPKSTRAAGGVEVEVKNGLARFMKKAFLVQLRGGAFGLAVRWSNGAPPRAWKPKQLAPGLWLLYAPSVDQMLRQLLKASGLIQDTSDFLADEFQRQMELKE